MLNPAIDRPVDLANRDYYQNKMLVRTVRIVVDVDVEWRDNDPDYCRAVARQAPIFMEGARVRNARTISAEFTDLYEHPRAISPDADGQRTTAPEPMVGFDPPLRHTPAILCRHCQLEIAAVSKRGDEYTGWVHAANGLLRCDRPSPSAWPYDGWRNGGGGGLTDDSV